MLDQVNPYEREIETCDHVIAYLTRKMFESGLIQDENLHELQKEVINQDNKTAVEKRINDGKIERALSKEEKEQEGMIQIGGKKGKPKGKKAKQNVVVTEVFNLDIQVISKFSFLKISPPLEPSELEAKIKELKDAKDNYIQEGEKKMADVQENGVEEEQEEEKEEVQKEDGKGRDRGDYRGGRGGYKKEGGRGKRQEFYEEEEEEERQPKKQAHRANRQEDLNKD